MASRLQSSEVAFGQLSGQVTALDGSTIGALVTGPTGSLSLTMNLSLKFWCRHTDRRALGTHSVVSLALRQSGPAAPRTATRVLHGLGDEGSLDPGLRSHLERWGDFITSRSG